MSKIKEGDKMPVTLVVVDTDQTEDGMMYYLTGLSDNIGGWVEEEELLLLTDPNYAERKRLQEIAELEKRLEELKTQ